MKFQSFATLLVGGVAVQAESFIPTPKDTTLVKSERFEGASISYKEASICETTEGVKSYSGYINIPKDLLSDAVGWDDGSSAHLFFWYFEARNDPKNAPTSIYLGGGPGETSMDMMSGFPCNINPDGNSTTLNKWAWNNDVNMLYIDQPIGAGFSYVTALNGSYDIISQAFTPVEDEKDLPEFNTTTVIATLDAQQVVYNTTAAAGRTFWQCVQIWTQEFPEWNVKSDEISLWGVSYAGFWGTGFFSHFIDENKLIKDGEPSHPNATELNLGTLGIGNGAIDLKSQIHGYIEFAVNNTYGIKAYDDEVYTQALANLTAPEVGCFPLVDNCRALAKKLDPKGTGNVDEVNEACVAASGVCFGLIQGAYANYGLRDVFDVTQYNTVELPRNYHTVYFNRRWVQEELGAAVNFTVNSAPVSNAYFATTGDAMVTDLSLLEHILDNGVNVALVYGDRDYRCNWMGAENVSLSVDFPSSSEFRDAGYADITTNDTYTGGLVRQYGSLSFSRVFQAGHAAGAYQPETMYRIFSRAMAGQDVATGEVSLLSKKDYASEGPASIRNVTNEVPELMKNVCAIYYALPSCSDEQLQALVDGSAVVENGIVVKPAGVTGAESDSSSSGSKDSGSGDGKSKDGDDVPPNMGGKVGASLWMGATLAAAAVLVMV